MDSSQLDTLQQFNSAISVQSGAVQLGPEEVAETRSNEETIDQAATTQVGDEKQDKNVKKSRQQLEFQE